MAPGPIPLDDQHQRQPSGGGERERLTPARAGHRALVDQRQHDVPRSARHDRERDAHGHRHEIGGRRERPDRRRALPPEVSRHVPAGCDQPVARAERAGGARADGLALPPSSGLRIMLASDECASPLLRGASEHHRSQQSDPIP